MCRCFITAITLRNWILALQNGFWHLSLIKKRSTGPTGEVICMMSDWMKNDHYMQDSFLIVCILFIMYSGLVTGRPKWWNVHVFPVKAKKKKRKKYYHHYTYQFWQWVSMTWFIDFRSRWSALLIKIEIVLNKFSAGGCSNCLATHIFSHYHGWAQWEWRIKWLSGQQMLRQGARNAPSCTDPYFPHFDTPYWSNTDTLCVTESRLSVRICSASQPWHWHASRQGSTGRSCPKHHTDKNPGSESKLWPWICEVQHYLLDHHAIHKYISREEKYQTQSDLYPPFW